MLTLGQLQTLKAISETGSFSKAARRLYLSQPAVSQRVKAMEDTLGVELFDRHDGGTLLSPTPAGTEVLNFATSTLEAYESLVKRLEDASKAQSVVTVGAVGFYLGTHVLPRILPLIRAVHPGLNLRMVNLPVEKLCESALSGAVDLVFMGQSRLVDGLDWRPIWEDEVVMVAHPSRVNELGRHPRVLPLIVSGTPNDVTLAQRWSADLGVPSQIVVESPHADTLRNAALANLGYALLPELVVRDELASGALAQVPVAGLPLRRVIVAAFTPERGRAGPVTMFLEALTLARKQLGAINPHPVPDDSSPARAAVSVRSRRLAAGA